MKTTAAVCLLFFVATLKSCLCQDGTYRPWPRPNSLRGFWPLNGYHRTKDISGHNADGIAHAGAMATTAVGPFGDPSSSYKSTSRTGIMSINGASATSFGALNSSFTISFNYKFPAVTSIGNSWCSGLLQFVSSNPMNRNNLQLHLCATPSNYSVQLYDNSDATIPFMGNAIPGVWNFVAITFDASTCSLTVYNRFGLAYSASYHPWLCDTLSNNASNDGGFVLGATWRWEWKTDIAVSCLNVYSAELNVTEIHQLHDTCRIILGSSQCGSPRLPGPPSAPYLPPVTARPGQFPFLASLRLASNHICAGSIIGDYWVLTAAKCFENSTILTQYSIVVGDYDLKESETFQRTHEIKNLVLHPDYGKFKGMTFNDIAVLELKQPIDFSNPYVNDICLPWFPEDMGFKIGSHYIAGWGPNGRSALGSQTVPRYSGLTKVDRASCESTWGDEPFEYENIVCSKGSPNASIPCHGDEGSPAFRPEGDHYPRITQVGIYSYREKVCLSDGKPSIFTDVRLMLEWVQSKIACIVPGLYYPINCPEKWPDQGTRTTATTPQTTPVPGMSPRDCQEILEKNPGSESGVYKIYAQGKEENLMKVYCEMRLYGGGWTVFQRRVDASQDFYLYWDDYKRGFGDQSANFWLGNDKISLMTKGEEKQNLLVALVNPGTFLPIYAFYNGFEVENETDSYRLRLDTFKCGNATDSLIFASEQYDYAGRHKNMRFTTRDKDNDMDSFSNCASTFGGAWWFNYCFEAHLNGRYNGGNMFGIIWSIQNSPQSKVRSEMMFRRRDLTCD